MIEHPSYCGLTSFGFLNQTGRHKYKFVNSVSGVHTQNVESLYSGLKCLINEQKGVKKEKGSSF